MPGSNVIYLINDFRINDFRKKCDKHSARNKFEKTTMDDKIIFLERVGIDSDVVQINFGKGAELPSSLSLIEEQLTSCFEKKDVRIILNLASIKYPPAKFIALLIEITHQARCMGGDVKLINVSNSVRNNLVTFSALNYLSIEESEDYALHDFGVSVPYIPDNLSNLHTEQTNIVSPDEPILINEPQVTSVDSFFTTDMITETIKVHSKTDCLYDICDFVMANAGAAGFNQRELSKIKVTVYEACLNVIEHAYFSNPDNWIEVSVHYDDEKLIIVIRDWGEGFKFEPKKVYDVEQAMKDRRTGGFGLHIIQRSVDEVRYEADSVLGNRLILVKYIRRKEMIIK